MATTKESVSGEITTEELRAKAKKLGIRFTKNTSDDVLLEKIEKAEQDTRRIINKETTSSKKTSMALQRVQVSPLNPLELNLPCKYVAFANRYVTVSKAVQFNTPIFLEECIIAMLKEQKYLYVKDNTEKHSLQPAPEHVYKDAYAITYLGTPTESEWKNDPQWKKMRSDKKLNDIANEGR